MVFGFRQLYCSMIHMPRDSGCDFTSASGQTALKPAAMGVKHHEKRPPESISSNHQLLCKLRTLRVPLLSTWPLHVKGFAAGIEVSQCGGVWRGCVILVPIAGAVVSLTVTVHRNGRARLSFFHCTLVATSSRHSVSFFIGTEAVGPRS